MRNPTSNSTLQIDPNQRVLKFLLTPPSARQGEEKVETRMR